MRDDWLLFRRLLLLIADYDNPCGNDEMPEHIFQALIEGRLSDVKDEIEEFDHEPDSLLNCHYNIVDAPIRLIALAALCKALLSEGEIVAMARPSAITNCAAGLSAWRPSSPSFSKRC